MKDYLKAQNSINEVVIKEKVTADELARFSVSDYRWARNKGENISHRQIKKGDVYQFEFGKNYIPEMSYEHRGLVIGSKHKLLYVLPIFSYDRDKHKDVFHPIDYPNSKGDFFLMKNADFPFIDRDSVLKLSDVRTVSVNRILYQHKGRLDPESDTYRCIEKLAFQKVFPVFCHDYREKGDLIKELKSQLENLKENEKAAREAERVQVLLDLVDSDMLEAEDAVRKSGLTEAEFDRALEEYRKTHTI